MWPRIATAARTILVLSCFGTNAALAQLTFVRHDISTGLQAAYGLHVVDVDRDGRLDILTASYDGTKWWRNKGAGSFQGSEIGKLRVAWWVYGADVDADGDIDVVASSPHPDANQVRLWKNRGDQTWDPPFVFPLLEAEAAHAERLNGDEVMEILGVSWAENLSDPGNDLLYFKDYRDTTYTTVMVDSNLSGAHALATGDIDNDGDMDIVASGDNRINIYRNDGGGMFSSPWVVSSLEGSLGFSLADVDRDGDLDIVCQGRTTQRVSWYEKTSGFNFSRHTVGTGIGECWSVHAADLDGDGDIDITAASVALNTIRAYLNDGFQNFTAVTVAENFPYARMEYPMDVDGDGDADILGVSATTSTLAWFESVVLPPSLSLASPNGGESWTVGTTQNIIWSYTGSIISIKIELSTDGGSTWQTVAATVPNSGTYSWVVPNAPSGNCRIRISDAANSSIADTSDVAFAIVAAAFRLTSPNGGESWLIGSTQNITWIDNLGVTTIAIDLSTDGGSTWQPIAASAPNTGSYSWTVPALASSNCRIRISDAVDGSPADASDADFTITPPRLILTSPNGGEAWFAGTTQNITWTTIGSISTVKLEISADNGTNWQTIVGSTSNTGSYLWTVPTVAASTCLVRIGDVANPARFDVSDNVFSISNQFVTVAMPNGGETLLLASSYSLTWNSTGPIDQVKIELSRNGGTTWEALASVTANDGSFAWTVSGAQSSNCLLRISDAQDGSPIDISDAPFSIAALAITVIAPNGGEMWSFGYAYTIRWATNGPMEAVKLEYTTDGGATWLVITEYAPNTGSFGWVVPNAVSNSCRVRISDAADGTPADLSDGVFQIVQPNRNPVAEAGGPYNAPRGVPITFDASRSSDPDGDNLSFVWEFGDGEFGSGVQASHSYPSLQTYTVTLTVHDGRGGESFDWADVTIYNRAPIADAAGLYNTTPGDTVHFDASASLDPDGDTISYLWNFGDDSPSYAGGPRVSHVYPAIGSYQVVLAVQDHLGSIGFDTTLVIISTNLFPVVKIGASELSVIGACGDTYPIELSIDQAYDTDGEIIRYEWDFGDSTPPSNRAGSVLHYFRVPGIYTVRMTVTDNEGAVAKDSIRVSLSADLPPTAAFTVPSDTVSFSTPVSFDARASSDLDGGIVTYVWNFGDGTVVATSQPTTTHAYQSNGVSHTVNVTLTVSDGCGKSSSAARTLHLMQPVSVAAGNNGGVPVGFVLSQNFPNPVSLDGGKLVQTRIVFDLPRATEVRLSIFNLFGQHVRTIVRAHYGAGNYPVVWDMRNDRGEQVSTGIYFYRLEADGYLATKKLVVTR